MSYSLPADYTKLTPQERREVRLQYIEEQNELCMFCSESLLNDPPQTITSIEIDWDLFPPNFLKSPIHLQHDHNTNMTEGAIHAYCNAVLWQYEGK